MTNTESARATFVSLFPSPSDAIAFENQALSIGTEFLPEHARAVLVDRDAATPEYYAWLCEQVEPEAEPTGTTAWSEGATVYLLDERVKGTTLHVNIYPDTDETIAATVAGGKEADEHYAKYRAAKGRAAKLAKRWSSMAFEDALAEYEAL